MTLIAPEYFNNHIAVEGEIIVKSVPNDTGSVLVWNPITKKISIRTHAEIVSDLNLMTTHTVQDVTGNKHFITQGGSDYTHNALQVWSYDGSNPAFSFHKSGINSAQLVFTGNAFSFSNSNDTDRMPVVASKFIKSNSDDGHFLTGGGGDYDSRKKEDAWFHSGRNFPSGTLIQTDVDYSQDNGDQFLLELKGNMYGGGHPLIANIQGYIYDGTIISQNGYSNLYYWNSITALNLNGKLCFWFPQLSYWQGFDVKVTTGHGGLEQGRNRVSNVLDSADPGGTKRVDIYLKHLLTKEELISGNTFWEKKDVGGYWALDSDRPIAGLNGSGAQTILSGGLLASSSYADLQFIPANGIHSKGFVQSDEGFFNRYWKADVRNPIWSFGNAQTYGFSYYQGNANSLKEGIGFHFGDTDRPIHYLGHSGLFYSKQGISSTSFDTGNSQVLNYGNPSTLYIGNPTINNIIESSNNDIVHSRNGVSGVVWDSHNLDPSTFVNASALNNYVPYNGAIQDVNFNQKQLTNAKLIQSEKFQWYNHSTKPFGKVTPESSFYNLGSNYGYGMSTNVGGGLDIMANQPEQPIRLWSGNDNDNPQQVARFIKDGTKFWGKSYIDINDKEYEILHKGNYASLLVTLDTPQSINAKKYFTQGLTVNTNYGGLPILGQMNNIPSKISAIDETYGMGMGIVDSGHGYIQQQRFDGTAHAYDLLLQPSGGNVVVGYNQMDYHNDKLETIGRIVSKGNEMNSVRTYVSSLDINQIIAGHTFNWYNTSWKVGNMRGDSSNSIGYRFEFSSDGGAVYEEKVRIHTDGNITTQNFGQAQQWNQAYQWGNHANGGYIKEWENAQAVGFSSGLSTGAPYIYHRTDGYVFLATQSWANSRFVNVDGQQNITGLKIIKGRARNTGTGWGNTSTAADYSFLVETESGSNPDNQYTGSIGFFSNSGAQAGIYVRSNDGNGTSMAFATTQLFSAGPQIAMTISNHGTVDFTRATPTVDGKMIFNAGKSIDYDYELSNIISLGYDYWNQRKFLSRGWSNNYGDYIEINVPGANANTASFKLAGSNAAYLGNDLVVTESWINNKFHKVDYTGSINNGSTGRHNTSWFDYNWAGSGRAGSVINFTGLNSEYSTELFMQYNGNGMDVGVRSRNGDTTDKKWNPERWLWHSGHFTKTDIDNWNNSIKVNHTFTNITNNGLMISDGSYGNESGLFNKSEECHVAGLEDEYYKYSSSYGKWEGINVNRGNKNIGIGTQANDTHKVNISGSVNISDSLNVAKSAGIGGSVEVGGSVGVVGSVKALQNFRSANEEPNTLFIPDGSLAYLNDEITNEDSRMRLSHRMIDQKPGIQYYGSENRMLVIRCSIPSQYFGLKECFPGQRILVLNTRNDWQSFGIENVSYGYRIPPLSSIQLFVWDDMMVYKYAENKM